jgi:SRSO17 transposase
MSTLVPSFLQLLQPFQLQMTAPTFASLVTVLTGWALCRRRHTVSGALEAVAGEHEKHFCAYHRLFAAARWDVEAVGLALADLILGISSGGGAIFLVVDDTLCRKRGRRLFGAGMHYDAQLTGRRFSNANRSIKSRGHCWVILGVVVSFPFRPGHHYCLPVLSRLYLNGDAALRRRRRAYRTKPQLALEMLHKLCAAFPARRFHLLADSAYGGKHLLGELPANCDFTCRWIKNAALYAPAPARVPGETGRRRVRGERLAGVAEMLASRCEHLTLVDLYGRRQSTCRVAVARDCRFHALPATPLTVVACEPLTDSGKPRPDMRAVFYTTVTGAPAEKLLTWYAMRWSIEVTIRDAKQELGLAQPQARVERAVRRLAPTLLLTYSLVVLWFAEHGHRGWRLPRHAWYPSKRHASFADMLATLRERTVRERFRAVLKDAGGARVPRNVVRTLLTLAKRAA